MDGRRYQMSPSSSPMTRVSHAERHEVVELLQVAYAEGRLDNAELDQRLGRAMTARTRGELDLVIQDLAPAPRPVAAPEPEATLEERVFAVLAHWSGFMSWIIGPLLVAVTAGRTSSFVRRHALEAANFQLTFFVAMIGLGFVAAVTLGIGALLIIPLILGWMFFGFVGGLAALLGRQFRYPLTLRPLR